MLTYNSSQVRILSLHWGFIPGGVSKYSTLINNVSSYAPIKIMSLCIRLKNAPFDKSSADYIGLKDIVIKTKLNFLFFSKVYNFINKTKPDLILTHGFNGCTIALLSSIGLNIPIYSSFHGRYYGSSLKQKICEPLFNFLSIILFKYFVKEIVTVSNFAKNYLLNKNIDPNKITVIHNCIDSSIQNPSFLKRTRANNFKGITIGTACRLDKTKDIESLIYSVYYIKNQIANFQVIIWGDGPYKQKLLRLTKNLSLDKYIHFEGYNSRASSMLHLFDIFVLPSIEENFSLALLEAMRAGLPIITTNVGGNPEAVINNESAILIPPNNPQYLGNKIITLCNDKEFRIKLGKNAKSRFKDNFTKDKMIIKIAQWLMTSADKLNTNLR